GHPGPFIGAEVGDFEFGDGLIAAGVGFGFGEEPSILVNDVDGFLGVSLGLIVLIFGHGGICTGERFAEEGAGAFGFLSVAGALGFQKTAAATAGGGQRLRDGRGAAGAGSNVHGIGDAL